MAKSTKKKTTIKKKAAAKAGPTATKDTKADSAAKAATKKAVAKKAAAKKTVKKKATAKTASKKKAAKKTAARKATARRPGTVTAAKTVTAQTRHALIAQAAYLRSEAQGFLGDAEADWLAAEAEVDRRLKKGGVKVRD